MYTVLEKGRISSVTLIPRGEGSIWRKSKHEKEGRRNSDGDKDRDHINGLAHMLSQILRIPPLLAASSENARLCSNQDCRQYVGRITDIVAQKAHNSSRVSKRAGESRER